MIATKTFGPVHPSAAMYQGGMMQSCCDPNGPCGCCCGGQQQGGCCQQCCGPSQPDQPGCCQQCCGPSQPDQPGCCQQCCGPQQQQQGCCQQCCGPSQPDQPGCFQQCCGNQQEGGFCQQCCGPSQPDQPGCCQQCMGQQDNQASCFACLPCCGPPPGSDESTCCGFRPNMLPFLDLTGWLQLFWCMMSMIGLICVFTTLTRESVFHAYNISERTSDVLENYIRPDVGPGYPCYHIDGGVGKICTITATELIYNNSRWNNLRFCCYILNFCLTFLVCVALFRVKMVRAPTGTLEYSTTALKLLIDIIQFCVGCIVFIFVGLELYQFWEAIPRYTNNTTGTLQGYWKDYEQRYYASMIPIMFSLCYDFFFWLIKCTFFVVLYLPIKMLFNMQGGMMMQPGVGVGSTRVTIGASSPSYGSADAPPCLARANEWVDKFLNQMLCLGFREQVWQFAVHGTVPDGTTDVDVFDRREFNRPQPAVVETRGATDHPQNRGGFNNNASKKLPGIEDLENPPEPDRPAQPPRRHSGLNMAEDDDDEKDSPQKKMTLPPKPVPKKVPLPVQQTQPKIPLPDPKRIPPPVQEMTPKASALASATTAAVAKAATSDDEDAKKEKKDKKEKKEKDKDKKEKGEKSFKKEKKEKKEKDGTDTENVGAEGEIKDEDRKKSMKKKHSHHHKKDDGETGESTTEGDIKDEDRKKSMKKKHSHHHKKDESGDATAESNPEGEMKDEDKKKSMKKKHSSRHKSDGDATEDAEKESKEKKKEKKHKSFKSGDEKDEKTEGEEDKEKKVKRKSSKRKEEDEAKKE